VNILNDTRTGFRPDMSYLTEICGKPRDAFQAPGSSKYSCELGNAL